MFRSTKTRTSSAAPTATACAITGTTMLRMSPMPSAVLSIWMAQHGCRYCVRYLR